MDDLTTERLLELGDLPILDDDALLDRATTLIECGVARRMWLLLLDDERRQLPLLPQIEGAPVSPDAETGATLSALLTGVAEVATHIAVVLERPGSARATPDDLAWADAIVRAAGRAPGVQLLGVLLAHGHGVDALW
ncbi:hypothetical protein [Agrococcus lahaulensis]|uniref:hypothetical protein n=1 Tax=Agrococcus lahaulensis TaxID=341722 RepID=UPI00047CC0A5|nr:hypothetical protein [Agrococcus lahaulensis]